ncbi:hypothetical protein [Thalassobacter stenotrophicus]|uniref:hypothetical protein n=1 Tax=Thalassobacter stenotrophicus TaxID=266809 RepID=UPI001057CDF9|nr:hypothetical protein [Thalassobacter stenotrophicus]
MEVRSTSIDLWPTRVTFFETPVDWVVNRQLADEAIAAVETNGSGSMANAAKRRVRGILEQCDAGHIVGRAQAFGTVNDEAYAVLRREALTAS